MKSVLLLPAAAALTLLAGCGSDDAGTAADPAPRATSTVTVTSTPTTTPTNSPTATSSGPAECAAADLTASLRDDAGGGAAGSVYSTIVLTNTGGVACTIEGFGGVSYVGGGDGTQVGAAAERSGDAGPAVLLDPGDAAGEQLQESEAGSYAAADCSPTPVDGLRIYPPDSTESLFVKHPTTGCSDDGVQLLTVSGYTAFR